MKPPLVVLTENKSFINGALKILGFLTFMIMDMSVNVLSVANISNLLTVALLIVNGK